MLRHTFSHIYKRYRRIIRPVLVGLVGLGILFYFYRGFDPKMEQWSKIIDPVLGLLTLLVAGFVWFDEMSREWEEKLPKRLTVIFKLQEGESYREVMRCEEAYLADSADIRQWGQQIGSQMTGGKRLDFQPFIAHDEPIVERNFKLYFITFFLTKLPDAKTPDDEKLFDFIRTKGLVWKMRHSHPPTKFSSYEDQHTA